MRPSLAAFLLLPPVDAAAARDGPRLREEGSSGQSFGGVWEALSHGVALYSVDMSSHAALEGICDRYGIVAMYLFGSRAAEGVARLDGAEVSAGGSDLDVGVVFTEPEAASRRLTALLVELEDILSPLAVDLVPLQALDPIFQFDAVDGYRVAAGNGLAADEYELLVMRRAAELLPIERRLEEEMFGASTA